MVVDIPELFDPAPQPEVPMDDNNLQTMDHIVFDTHSHTNSEEEICVDYWSQITWPKCNLGAGGSDEMGSGGDDDDEVSLFEDEDGNNEDQDIVNWEEFANSCGLSAWDQLGTSYETDAANIGMQFCLVWVLYSAVAHLVTFVVEKLTTYNHAICCAFAYKVQTHTTDRAF